MQSFRIAPWCCNICEKDLPEASCQKTRDDTNIPVSIYAGGCTSRSKMLCFGRACGGPDSLCTHALMDQFTARHRNINCSSSLRCCWCKQPSDRTKNPVVIHLKCTSILESKHGDSTDVLEVVCRRNMVKERRLLLFCSKKCCGSFSRTYKTRCKNARFTDTSQCDLIYDML